MAGVKFLQNYPFKNLGVEVAKGFSNDAGAPEGIHPAIDYRRPIGGQFASFEVYTMFEGSAKFGVSDLLGKFFTTSIAIGPWEFEVVYAHLDLITEDLQKYAIIQGSRDFIIPAGYLLGWAGKTGHQKTVRQLHIEVWQKNSTTKEVARLDPYGLYDAHPYPQPGQSLAGFNHLWLADDPKFIT